MNADEDSPSDLWWTWLLPLRNGGNRSFEEMIGGKVEALADRVLDGVGLRSEMSIADIGTGDGLVAFRAIDRIGPSLKVILADISLPLLKPAQARATERNVTEQCTFIQCSADKLTGIPDGTLDAVTTRAVLAYVANKASALDEFHRVLKPGARISLAEPIFQDEAYTACMLKNMVEAQDVGTKDPFLPLLYRWKAAQYPDTLQKLAASPITNFSERTLFEIIRASGFVNVHLEFHMDLQPSTVPTWDVFIESSPHPWAPTLNAIIAEQFTAQERKILEDTMRPLVETGQLLTVDRVAFYTATKKAN